MRLMMILACSAGIALTGCGATWFPENPTTDEPAGLYQSSTRSTDQSWLVYTDTAGFATYTSATGRFTPGDSVVLRTTRDPQGRIFSRRLLSPVGEMQVRL